jgi:hypothetical protein
MEVLFCSLSLSLSMFLRFMRVLRLCKSFIIVTAA